MLKIKKVIRKKNRKKKPKEKIAIKERKKRPWVSWPPVSNIFYCPFQGQLLRQGSREIGENSAIIGVTSLASHHTHHAHQSSLSTGSQGAGHGQS